MAGNCININTASNSVSNQSGDEYISLIQTNTNVWVTSPRITSSVALQGVQNLTNQYRFTPLVVNKKCTIQTIAIHQAIAGGISGRIKVAVYTDNGNLEPDQLIQDAGDIGTEALTGYLQLSNLNIDLPNSGLYWIAIQGNATSGSISGVANNAALGLSVLSDINLPVILGVNPTTFLFKSNGGVFDPYPNNWTISLSKTTSNTHVVFIQLI